MGILAITSLLNWFYTTYFIFKRPIMIHTDSASAILLAKLRGVHSTKFALHNDINCVLELQKSLKQTSLVSLCHVIGHQDRTKPFEALFEESKMNVLMDRAVGTFISTMTSSTRNNDRAPILPTQKVCIISRGRIVIAMIREHLIGNFSFPTRIQYLIKHLNLTTDSVTRINWTALSRFLRRKRI